MVGVEIPQLTFKHAYVVTDAIPGILGTPIVKDHLAIYMKPQGSALQFGGYEINPHLVEKVSEEMKFFVKLCFAYINYLYLRPLVPWWVINHISGKILSLILRVVPPILLVVQFIFAKVSTYISCFSYLMIFHLACMTLTGTVLSLITLLLKIASRLFKIPA